MNRIVVLVFMSTALGASEKIKEMNRRQAGKKIILYLNLFFCQIWVNAFVIYTCVIFFCLPNLRATLKFSRFYCHSNCKVYIFMQIYIPMLLYVDVLTSICTTRESSTLWMKNRFHHSHRKVCIFYKSKSILYF